MPSFRFNKKGSPLAKAVLSLFAFCLLFALAACGDEHSGVTIPSTSEGEILTFPLHESYTSPGISSAPAETVSRYILRTQSPPEETAAPRRERQSLLLTDIYASGAGISENSLASMPSTSGHLAAFAEYLLGKMIYEIHIETDNSVVAAAGEFKNVSSMFDAGADIFSIMDLVHYETHCYRTSTFNTRSTAVDGSYVVLKRGIQLSQSVFDTYVDDYYLATNAARQIVSEVLQELPENASDEEIAAKLMYRLADICSYDIQIGDAGRSAYGALVLGKTVCEGYAVAYCMLLKTAGIDCVGISSSNYTNPEGGAGHAWVALKLNGVIHWADPTWFDGSYADGTSFYDTKWLPTTDMSLYRDEYHILLDYPAEEIYRYWELQ